MEENGSAMEYVAITAAVLVFAWLLLSELGLPAALWFEEHRAVRPVLLGIVAVLLLALLIRVAKRFW